MRNIRHMNFQSETAMKQHKVTPSALMTSRSRISEARSANTCTGCADDDLHSQCLCSVSDHSSTISCNMMELVRSANTRQSPLSLMTNRSRIDIKPSWTRWSITEGWYSPTFSTRQQSPQSHRTSGVSHRILLLTSASVRTIWALTTNRHSEDTIDIRLQCQCIHRNHHMCITIIPGKTDLILYRTVSMLELQDNAWRTRLCSLNNFFRRSMKAVR